MKSFQPDTEIIKILTFICSKNADVANNRNIVTALYEIWYLRYQQMIEL